MLDHVELSLSLDANLHLQTQTQEFSQENELGVYM